MVSSPTCCPIITNTHRSAETGHKSITGQTHIEKKRIHTYGLYDDPSSTHLTLVSLACGRNLSTQTRRGPLTLHIKAICLAVRGRSPPLSHPDASILFLIIRHQGDDDGTCQWQVRRQTNKHTPQSLSLSKSTAKPVLGTA